MLSIGLYSTRRILLAWYMPLSMVVCVRACGEYRNLDRDARYVLSSVSPHRRPSPLFIIREDKKTALITARRGYICAKPQGDIWDTFSCTRLYTDPPRLIVPQESNGRTTYMETTLGDSIVGYADQIEVRFQKADFETAASTTSSASSSQTSAELSRPSDTGKPLKTAAGNSTGADTGAGGQSAGKKGLTTGSYAGIGVVVGVVMIAIVAVILFLVRIRRKRSGETEALDGNWTPDHSAAEMANSTPACEVGHREVGEVRGDLVMPVELDPKATVHQLE
jgi:hypothetical protein